MLGNSNVVLEIRFYGKLWDNTETFSVPVHPLLTCYRLDLSALAALDSAALLRLTHLNRSVHLSRALGKNSLVLLDV